MERETGGESADREVRAMQAAAIESRHGQRERRVIDDAPFSSRLARRRPWPRTWTCL